MKVSTTNAKKEQNNFQPVFCNAQPSLFLELDATTQKQTLGSMRICSSNDVVKLIEYC